MRYSKYISPILFAGDIILLNTSFILSYFLKFKGLDNLLAPPYLQLLIYANIAWIILALITSPYRLSRIVRFARLWRGHFTLIILHFLLITAFFVLFKAYYYSRIQLITNYAIFVALIFIWRASFIYLIRIFRQRGFNYRNVVVIGHGELSEELHKVFRLHPEFGYRFLGFFDNKYTGPRSLGAFGDLYNYNDHHIDEIYCCLPYIRYSQIKDIIDFGEKNLVKVKLIADFRGFSFKGLELERYDHIPVLKVTSTPLDEKKNQLIKRAFDIAFSGVAILFVLSWLIPLISLLIKIDSRGPIFFKQKRTGKDNKVFWCFKFRTMTVNRNADKLQATKDDPRITRIGSFLRKTSLDEIPQFFNVLTGEMSVVGPRPHMLKHTEEYSRLIEKFMARHFVKPGITGLAQAKGYRGETRSLNMMKNRVRLDRFYVENWSIYLDMKILALTVGTLIRGDENAY